jgi:hypothetical protein
MTTECQANPKSRMRIFGLIGKMLSDEPNFLSHEAKRETDERKKQAQVSPVIQEGGR